MQTEIKKLEKCQIEIKGEINWLDFQGYFEKALEQLSANVVIDGFRLGKAPKDIVLKKIGEEKVLFEAANLCLQFEYPKIVKENNLEPIAPPQVSILKLAKSNPFEFKINIDVLPEFDLPDYKKIAKETKIGEAKVEEKDIEEALLFLRKSRATFEPLNRPSQKGDYVSVKYQSPELESNKQFEDKFILGEGQLVEGFEDNLIGLSEGGKKTFAVVFPNDYLNKAMAGKKADFSIEMKKVEKTILPELSDEFIKTLGKFESLDGLKKSLSEGILQEKQNEQKNIFRKDVLDKIAKDIKIDLPQGLVIMEKERLLKQFKQGDVKEEDIAKIAEQNIKNYLVINQIAKQESVVVSDKEAEETAKMVLKNYPESGQGDNSVDPRKLTSYYKERLLEEKVFHLLENYAVNSDNN